MTAMNTATTTQSAELNALTIQIRSETANCAHRRGNGFQRVAQRQRKWRCLDLEHISVLRLDMIGEGERRGSEKMHVQVSRPAKQGVFKMMVFQIPDMVRHIRLPGEERLLPYRLAGARDARAAADVGRQFAQQQL